MGTERSLREQAEEREQAILEIPSRAVQQRLVGEHEEDYAGVGEVVDGGTCDLHLGRCGDGVEQEDRHRKVWVEEEDARMLAEKAREGL